MAIQNMPAAIQAAIQVGFLETEFHTGLNSAIGYRAIADREPVSINVGETVTKTRTGLKAPVTTAINPTGNTNLDNGLTPTPFTIEQYTLGISMFGDTIDLNVVTSQVGIANQFLKNAFTNGMQARQSLDRLARNALFNAYLGGATRVRVTLGAPALTISVDDVRGFQNVLVNSQMVPVSGTNTVTLIVGANSYVLNAVAIDGSNVSTSPLGVSGTLTFTSNVTVGDGTALNTVQHPNAPALVRPNGKWTGGSATSATTATSSLIAADVLTLGVIEDAVAQLRNNTGMQDEMFNLYLDNVSMRQLFADQDFKLMYQGQYGAPEARQGKMFQLFGVNFIPTTEALVQVANVPAGINVKVRRPILAAPGALIEGDFAGMVQKAKDMGSINAEIQMIDSVVQVVRAPIDRLQQIIAQSWFWIGGFVAPTDATANSTIIPTAGAQYLKRAVVIEHAG